MSNPKDEAYAEYLAGIQASIGCIFHILEQNGISLKGPAYTELIQLADHTEHILHKPVAATAIRGTAGAVREYMTPEKRRQMLKTVE